MSKNLHLFSLLVIALGTAVFAAQADAASPGEDVKTNYVSIETPAGGEPMLVVRYPWTAHQKPSIEVRTYVQGEEESVRIRPLHFNRVFMKGRLTVKVYDTQAASSATRTTIEFTRGEIKFNAIGQRNVLDRPAVCVTCQTEILKRNKDAFPEKARWALYPFMDPWAANDKTLFLSLPEPMFSGPAKIRVFFLRDDDLIWSETKQWPGLNSGDRGQAPASRTPG